MCISERLRQVCEHKQWKIKDFAEITGLPYRTMQGYIGGEREPNAEGMAAIAKIGINLNWLLLGQGDMFIHNMKENISSQEFMLINNFRDCDKQIQDVMMLAIKKLSNK